MPGLPWTGKRHAQYAALHCCIVHINFSSWTLQETHLEPESVHEGAPASAMSRPHRTSSEQEIIAWHGYILRMQWKVLAVHPLELLHPLQRSLEKSETVSEP